MILAQVAAEIPGSLWALGIGVGTGLVGAIGLLFRLLLAEKDGRREDNRASTAAILAERSASLATMAPLADGVGKLAAAVSDNTRVTTEQRDSGNALAKAVDRQTTAVEKIWERAIEQRRAASSSSMQAVKP